MVSVQDSLVALATVLIIKSLLMRVISLWNKRSVGSNSAVGTDTAPVDLLL